MGTAFLYAVFGRQLFSPPTEDTAMGEQIVAELTLVQIENRRANNSADHKNGQHNDNKRIHALPLLVSRQLRE